MSYKKILVSDNGKFKQIQASIDNNSLSSSLPISTNTASLDIPNGLLVYQNNVISSLTGTVQNEIALFENNSTKTVQIQNTSYVDVGGDLKSKNGNIVVDNISNVNSGSLRTDNGGTGKGSSLALGSLISAQGINIIENNVSKVVSISSVGEIILKNLEEIFTYTSPVKIYLYTLSNATFTWVKPSGCNMIRVICQGGGGGGGSGGRSGASSHTSTGGAGGGGGGTSDVILNAQNLSTVNINVGGGGAGGIATTGNSGIAGSNGGNSSFGSYVVGYGGSGGQGARFFTRSSVGGFYSNSSQGGAGGAGYSTYGGNGGAGGFGYNGGCLNAEQGYSISGYIGAPGGGGGAASGNSVAGGCGLANIGGYINGSGITNTSTYRNFFHKGASGGYASVAQNIFVNSSATTVSSDTIMLLSAGCSGGAYNTAGEGGNGRGGSRYAVGGGGGGSQQNSSTTQKGKDGGGGGYGYVMVICY